MNNEPAFPFTEMHTHGSPYTQWKGMTLRDYFAAKAMADLTWQFPESCAQQCYQIADAMLKARDGNP
jgi:hypothetical protein